MYGIMAEIFGRENGFAKGLGNSMHAFFIPFGVYPNNAIVGGSAPIAAGAALHKKVAHEKGGLPVLFNFNNNGYGRNRSGYLFGKPVSLWTGRAVSQRRGSFRLNIMRFPSGSRM